MTILLPLLMLGVAVAADQPQPASSNQLSTASMVKTDAAPAIANSQTSASSDSRNPFVAEGQTGKRASGDAQDEARKQTCFTMRSYFFQREDDQAMSFLGMTRCDPGRAVMQKHVRSHPRLVPAN